MDSLSVVVEGRETPNRSVYYWKGEHVVVYGISGNGYISTAFVSRKGKFM